jgi:hypothetical protein
MRAAGPVHVSPLAAMKNLPIACKEGEQKAADNSSPAPPSAADSSDASFREDRPIDQ